MWCVYSMCVVCECGGGRLYRVMLLCAWTYCICRMPPFHTSIWCPPHIQHTHTHTYTHVTGQKKGNLFKKKKVDNVWQSRFFLLEKYTLKYYKKMTVEYGNNSCVCTHLTIYLVLQGGGGGGGGGGVGWTK